MKKIGFILFLFINLTQGILPQQYNNGKWGFVDSSGGWVIPPKYDKVEKFNEGFAGVRYATRCGFIDTQGNLRAAIYDNIWSFRYGCAIVQLNGKMGAIDTTGQIVVPIKYDWLGEFDGYSYKYLIGEEEGEVGRKLVLEE